MQGEAAAGAIRAATYFAQVVSLCMHSKAVRGSPLNRMSCSAPASWEGLQTDQARHVGSVAVNTPQQLQSSSQPSSDWRPLLSARAPTAEVLQCPMKECFADNLAPVRPACFRSS